VQVTTNQVEGNFGFPRCGKSIELPIGNLQVTTNQVEGKEKAPNFQKEKKKHPTSNRKLAGHYQSSRRKRTTNRKLAGHYQSSRRKFWLSALWKKHSTTNRKLAGHYQSSRRKFWLSARVVTCRLLPIKTIK
jgi:hypothetical protein